MDLTAFAFIATGVAVAAFVQGTTIALCFLVGQLMSLAMLAVAGRADARQFTAALWLSPALVAGAVLSRFVHHRVRGRTLRVLVLVFAIVSGAVLRVRG